MKKLLNIEIAGHIIGLNIDEKAPGSFWEETGRIYEIFLSGKKPAISIDVEFSNSAPPQKFPFSKLMFKDNIISVVDDCLLGELELLKKSGSIKINPVNPVYPLGTFLRNVSTLLVILEDKGVALHAVGVLDKGQAYIFIGPSKAGKSTVARLSPQETVLSDDLLLIKKAQGEFQVFPAPDWGDKQRGDRQNKPYRIKGMFKLIKDKQVFLERFSPGRAAADMFTIPHIPPEFIPQEELLSGFLELASRVPYFGLHFLPEPSFWELIEKDVSQSCTKLAFLHDRA